MDWFVWAAPSALLALVVILPGWAVLTALGRRGVRAVTAAPAVSVGVVVLAGVLVDRTGGRWGVVPVALVCVALVAGVLAVRRWGVRRSPPGVSTGSTRVDPADRWRTPTGWAVLGASVGALLLWLRHLTNVIPSPHAMSQTFDNVFHFNVLRYISDTGDPGPWLPTALEAASGRTFFYPTAWHQLMALGLPFGDGSLQVASNAALLVVCGIVWPLAALELVLALGVRSPGALLGTGVLSASFSAFPFLMLDWGVLYPNLLAYASVPTALALLVALITRDGSSGLAPVPLLVALALATGGIALAQPNGVLLSGALSLPAVALAGVRVVREAVRGRLPWWQAARWGAATGVALVGFVVVWLRARPTNRPWQPLHDVLTALLQALGAHPILGPPGWVPALLSLAGFLLLLRRPRMWWFLGSALVALLLWVVVSGYHDGRLRELLTGVWYSDSYRLAPPLVLVAVPAAAVAVERALALVPTPRTRTALAASLVAPALILATTQWSPSLHAAVTHAATAYDFADEHCVDGDVTCLLTEDEYTVLMSVERLTPPDAVILGDPWTGASLAYAFGGRAVPRPYIGPNPSPAEQLLLDRLDETPDDPAVCAALRETGVTHVLDFGRRTVHGWDLGQPGVDHLDHSPAVSLLFRSGDVGLYEVVACR